MAESIKKEKTRDNFTSGVLMLSLSAIIVKIIGLFYKIPMLRLLGSEGMGYFNSAYEIYALFCSVATTGLPVAMSVMISSDKSGGARGIFRAAIKLFAVLGLLGGCTVFAFARPFASFLGNVNAAPCLLAISPCVLVICIASAYRGYFQGLGRMGPTAISQMTEALGKLVLGFLFAFVALDSGFTTEYVAAFAVLGLTLGTTLSALYLALTKRLCRTDSQNGGADEKGIAKKLLATAVPVTLSSLVVSLTKVIDMSIILRRLQDTGESGSEAFSIYGSYTTLALPLFSLAPALITAVAMPLIPSLASAISSNDREGQVSVVGKAFGLTAFISLPVAFGLTLFSRPILELLFAGETSAIDSAAPLLSVLGFSVVSSCFITVGNAVLQAYGKPSVPIFSMAAGALLKIILAYALIGHPEIGILGAPISTFVCDMAVNFINFYFICRALPSQPRLGRTLLSPFLAAAVSVSLARVAYNAAIFRFGDSRLITLAVIALAAALYFAFCLLLGGREALSFVKSRIETKEKDI